MKTKIRLPQTRYFIEVFIWKDRDELHKKTFEKGQKKNYGAMYCPTEYTIYPCRKVLPKLGEIHFYKGRTGVGLISHEVLHCIFDYAQKKGTGKESLDISDNNKNLEHLCFMQGELVRKIALWFIKVKDGQISTIDTEE